MSAPAVDCLGDLNSPTVNDSCCDRARFEELRSRHLAEARELLEKAISRLDWPREKILAHQTSRLRIIVDHAKKHSPYYRGKLADVDPESIVATDLTALPVVRKETVMKHWDEIVTDGRLKLADVTRHLEDVHAGRKQNPYYLDEYNIFATGGTSGTRGVFIWDWEMVKNNVCMAYRWEERHDRLFLSPKRHKRTALICTNSLTHVSGNILPMCVMLDPEREAKNFTAGMPIEDLVEGLNEYQPDRIWSYSSIIEDLSRRAQRGELKVNPEWITAMAEPLEDSARENAQKAWGINIYDGYGTTEFGCGAFDSPTCDGMCLAEDNIIVEVVDENYQPVTDLKKNQEEERKILVTRLYGGTFPLIRYEVTDSLIFREEAPRADDVAPGLRRIDRIEGRTDVRFEYNRKGNVVVHPIVSRTVLVQYRDITEYQVQQTTDGAHILIIQHNTFDLEKLRSELENSLALAGLEEPVVTIDVVDVLRRHSETKKLRKFVPLKQ